MTELERARAHLQKRQAELQQFRAWCGAWGDTRFGIEERETAVLAALSWVWEEQEKDRTRDFVEIETGFTRVAPGKYMLELS